MLRHPPGLLQQEFIAPATYPSLLNPWPGTTLTLLPFSELKKVAIITLPHVDGLEQWVVRLRSYAGKGVFVPSVVFLDSELSPVRLVTDLVSDFEPENWHRRGYLEARIPVFAAKEERWMLVFTRARDLEGQTVIETRRGPLKIPHVSTGEFGLIMMGAQ